MIGAGTVKSARSGIFVSLDSGFMVVLRTTGRSHSIRPDSAVVYSQFKRRVRTAFRPLQRSQCSARHALIVACEFVPWDCWSRRGQIDPIHALVIEVLHQGRFDDLEIWRDVEIAWGTERGMTNLHHFTAHHVILHSHDLR